MTENTQNAIELKPGEVITSMMFYTSNALIWGDVVHHESILASRILTGATIPEYVAINNAQIIFAQLNFMSKPTRRKEIFLPSNQVNAYHLTPPQEDQLDYDPTEPNRIMTPVEVTVAPFTTKANIRISGVTTVKSTLEVLKADFTTFYDAETTHTNNPNMKPIRTNLILIRLKSGIFTLA